MINKEEMETLDKKRRVHVDAVESLGFVLLKNIKDNLKDITNGLRGRYFTFQEGKVKELKYGLDGETISVNIDWYNIISKDDFGYISSKIDSFILEDGKWIFDEVNNHNDYRYLEVWDINKESIKWVLKNELDNKEVNVFRTAEEAKKFGGEMFDEKQAEIKRNNIRNSIKKMRANIRKKEKELKGI